MLSFIRIGHGTAGVEYFKAFYQANRSTQFRAEGDQCCELDSTEFAGWSAVAAVCAAVGALGGVLVALCLKHADSVTKTIATTGAIVLTTLVNAAFLDGPMSLAVATGALLVVLSVFSFNDNGEQRDNC